MMNVRRFEGINGHPPEIIKSGSTGLCRAACVCDCSGRTIGLTTRYVRGESRALELLLSAVLQEHGRICMEKANWKCSNCGRTTGLSAHHKVFRSHGRDDRVQNLSSDCTDCHGRKHGAKQAKP